MGVWKLRFSMAGTLAIIIGLSTLFFTVVLSLLEVFNLITLGILVVTINIVQWLASPYLIKALYRTRELPLNENPPLHAMVEDLSKKTGIKKPKLMIAQIPIPNAFAYGSPLAGNHMAVTDGLLKTLNSGEVEAVIGHELGHLRHKDVQTMMFVSMLPSLLYYAGYSLMWSTRGNRREGSGDLAMVSIVFMAFSWILTLLILNLSRVREYYADIHSAEIVDNGSGKLSTGLVKIVQATKNIRRTKSETKTQSAFKALFISDPDHADIDAAKISRMQPIQGERKIVQEIITHKLTTTEKLAEILSTHPNITKRLKALQELD
jgi:heat shock protein HtpX